tara:strand:- start:1034 stop:3016 length:1983 start_codon:yes stop_codon:yes gene_type:complete
MIIFLRNIIIFIILNKLIFSTGLFLNPDPSNYFKTKKIDLRDSLIAQVELRIWFPDVSSQLIQLNGNDKPLIKLIYEPFHNDENGAIVFNMKNQNFSYSFPIDKIKISRFNSHLIKFKIKNDLSQMSIFYNDSLIKKKLNKKYKNFSISTLSETQSLQHTFEIRNIKVESWENSKLNKVHLDIENKFKILNQKYFTTNIDEDIHQNGIINILKRTFHNKGFLRTVYGEKKYIINHGENIYVGNYYDKPYTVLYKSNSSSQIDFSSMKYNFFHVNASDKPTSFYYVGGSSLFPIEKECKIIKKDFDNNYYGGSTFTDPLSGDLYIVGGYGQYTFKKQIRKYDFDFDVWNNIEYISNDTFDYRNRAIVTPRDNKSVFIYGTAGNKNGHQKFGKNKLNDLWEYNIKSKSLTKLKENVFPISNIPDPSSIDAIYAKEKLFFFSLENKFNKESDNLLNIWTISLDDTNQAILKETLPIKFDLVSSSLRYDENNNMLTFLQRDIVDDKTHIYTSSILLPLVKNFNRVKPQKIILYLISGILLTIIIFYFYSRKNYKKIVSITKNGIEIKKIEPLEVFLDGKILDFNQSERPGIIKELFLCIVNSNKQKVDHHVLKDKIWPDVQDKSFVNSLNVSLSNLRKLLGPYGKDLKQKNKSIFLETIIKKPD